MCISGPWQSELHHPVQQKIPPGEAWLPLKLRGWRAHKIFPEGVSSVL